MEIMRGIAVSNPGRRCIARIDGIFEPIKYPFGHLHQYFKY